MTAQQLVRLYPPAWKARYAEEFVALVGTDPLHVQQVVDIVSGAIDAWLSRDARRALSSESGGTMRALSFACLDSKPRYSVRDGIIGSFVIVLVSLAFLAMGVVARRAGLTLPADVVRTVAFPSAMALSMPFWLLKGQSRRVQLAVIGVTIAFSTVVSLV